MTSPPSHNHCRRARWLAWVVLLAVGPGTAFTAEFQLILRNGDRLSGRVVSEDTNRVTLTNAVLGTISVPLREIARRVHSAVAPAAVAETLDAAAQKKLDDLRAAYVTGLFSSAEYHRQRARLLSQVTMAQPATVAAVQLTPEGAGGPPATHPPKAAMSFSGEIQAGLDLALATKDRQLYTGRLKLQHAYSQLRNSADYLFTYGRSDGELTANRMDGTIKTDYDLTGPWYAYNQGNAGYDELRKLDNYWQIGPGGGWRAVRGTNFVLNLEAGINFQQQHRSDGTDTDVVYYRLAEHGKSVLNSRFTLDQKLEYFPQWNDLQEYKLRFEGTLKLWLYNNLSLNLTLINLYDTMPAQGVDRNDLQIRSTIGVRF